MKKLLVVITIILVVAALFFVSPIFGKVRRGETVYYGTVLAPEGGGGI